MANPSALATAGNEQTPGALQNLAAPLLNPATPAAPAATATPAPTVAIPEATLADNKLTIGGQTYELTNAVALIQAGSNAAALKAQVDAQIEALGTARFYYDLSQDLSEPETHHLLDAIEEIKTSRQTGKALGSAKTLVLDKLDQVPEDYKEPNLSEMDDPFWFLYQTMAGLRTEVLQLNRETKGTLAGMQQWAQGQQQVTADEQTARQMSTMLGRSVTTLDVKTWRENGITDPLKALPFLTGKPAAVAPVPAPNGQQRGTPPPEAPAGVTATTFEDNGQWSNEQLLDFYNRGLAPSDPVLAKLFEETMSRAYGERSPAK